MTTMKFHNLVLLQSFPRACDKTTKVEARLAISSRTFHLYGYIHDFICHGGVYATVCRNYYGFLFK